MIENLCLLVDFWLMKYLKLEMDQHFADELKFKISLHCCYHAVLLPLLLTKKFSNSSASS